MIRLEIFSKIKSKFLDYTKYLLRKTDTPKLNNYIKEKKKIIIVGSLSGFIIASSFGFFYYQANVNTLYHVYLNGEKIGTVSDKSLIETWMSDRLAEAQLKYGLSNLTVETNITFEKEEKFRGENNNLKALEILNDRVIIEAKGVEIIVDGKVIGAVKDMATFESLNNRLKEVYIPKKEKEKVVAASISESSNEPVIKLESVIIKEEISTEEKNLSPDEIIDEETMLSLLQKGTLEEKTYIVKAGDTISEIALMNDLTTQEVYQQNPNLKGELINIGDELTVTSLTPLVTVETTETVTRIERIPYSISYKKDSSMYKNESKVVVNGKEGKEEVQYLVVKDNGILVEKTVLDEKVLEEPVTKVIAKGIKDLAEQFIPSIWPTSGRVSSYYGYRKDPFTGKQSFHNGLDIANKYGAPIYATANGTVTFSGWTNGGYGNEVIIKHGNGFITYYGHNSKNIVKKGDYVKKGQIIAYVGSTGRSTGPHVDYRISKNGKKVNPINYIK